MQKQLLVGVDVGYRNHHVAISAPIGIVDQFEISHDNKGFEYLFDQISTQAHRFNLTDVVVGMEGTNGFARPLDQMVKDKGYIF